MALATSTIVGLAIAAAASAASAYNTKKTADKQDQALATDIRNQSAKQRESDAKVNEEIARIGASTSADEKAHKLEQYTDAVRKKGSLITAGMDGSVGGEDFQADSQQAGADTMQYGLDNASLMSRIDAPIDQRTGEAVSYGNLGIDLNTIKRAADGQHFLDQLRVQGVKRNPWIDAGAQFASAVGGNIGGGAMTAGTSAVGTGGGQSSGVLSSFTNAMGSGGYGQYIKPKATMS